VGFEYKICFQVDDPAEIETFLESLCTQHRGVQDPGDFTVTLESDGFYFCDHTKSERSSYVLAWRNWLEAHEVRQPFKQAHREIYLVTDAQRETAIYSNRFAAHIVRQHQFAALCQERGC
jgi:hypothetical protein